MEMLATARSIDAAQSAAPKGVSEADIDRSSRESFLESLPLAQASNLAPFLIIALCLPYLANWRLMGIMLGLNLCTLAGMRLVALRLATQPSPRHERRCWRTYEALAFMAGLLWAAMMLPVSGLFGQDVAAMFVCVVVVVTIAVTTMVVASQLRIAAGFLAGVMLGLLPQTIAYMQTIGPIPLVATIGLAAALAGLVHSVRSQHRLMVRTKLENRLLADELSEALEAAEYLAKRDSLTGLYNRRAFEEAAIQIRLDPDAGPISLILIDLDHFKAINDRYGHAVGDSVLKLTADFINRSLGPRDLVGRGDGAIARWGGEEFLMLLPNSAEPRARRVAEILRYGISHLKGHDWPAELTVSGSLGVAVWNPSDRLERAIAKADEAMYRAKAAGRNRVRLFSDTARQENVG